MNALRLATHTLSLSLSLSIYIYVCIYIYIYIYIYIAHTHTASRGGATGTPPLDFLGVVHDSLGCVRDFPGMGGGTQDKKMSKSLSTLQLEGSPAQSRISPSIQRIPRLSVTCALYSDTASAGEHTRCQAVFLSTHGVNMGKDFHVYHVHSMWFVHAPSTPRSRYLFGIRRFFLYTKCVSTRPSDPEADA